MTWHCMFEQSGTFKNELKKLGQVAHDYDILNDFGETDFVIDLYDEINKEYEREREYLCSYQARGRYLGFLSLHKV